VPLELNHKNELSGGNKNLFKRSSILVDNISNKFLERVNLKTNSNFLKQKLSNIKNEKLEKEFILQVNKLYKICIDIIRSKLNESLFIKFMEIIKNENYDSLEDSVESEE